MRFMTTSLSKLVDNLTEGFTKLSAKNAIFFLSMKVSAAIQ